MVRKLINNKLMLISISIISLSIFFVYNETSHQATCESSYNNLIKLQNQLKELQSKFDSNIKLFKNNMMNKDDVIKHSKSYGKNIENLINSYKRLDIPIEMHNSDILYKMSLDTQYKSNQLMIKWLNNQNDSNLIRSNYFLQNSFEYESGAITLYNNQISKCF
ncbi:MAG: hypothetical protein OXF28_01125 [Thaumarchaeota archaeon]|nr:hypothetical protein [Nitrososphaerota archaeon]MCY3975723.1 hypothetical protein [Nitrososphaerota archaeon]